MPVENVAIDMIDPPCPLLRVVDESSLFFLELTDQIRSAGKCLQAPPARPRGNGRYQIADGNYRRHATIKAGIDSMPLHIMEMTDEQYLVYQMICNSQHNDTRWAEYARHLERLRYMGDTELTISELATKCEKSTQWVREVLRLNELKEPIAEMVNRGQICLSNAKWLAKLAPAYQDRQVENAKNLTSEEFQRVIRDNLIEIRERITANYLNKHMSRNMHPVMRAMKEIKQELANPEQIVTLIAASGLTDPVEIGHLVLKWAFSLDDATVAIREEKFEQYELQHMQRAFEREEERQQIRFKEISQIGP